MAASHGLSKTPTYSTWAGMRTRCQCVTNKDYPRYGGRGIRVCERWSQFENFLADMGERPPGLTIDRYPNGNGNYEPGNCRWATVAEQNKNRSSTRWLEAFGRRQMISEWASEIGMKPESLVRRIDKLGLPPEIALQPQLRLAGKSISASNVFIEYQGRRLTVSQWAYEIGMRPETLRKRFRRGWSAEQALTKPLLETGRWAPL